MTSCFFPGRMKPWAELEARPPEAFPEFFFSNMFHLSLSPSPTASVPHGSSPNQFAMSKFSFRRLHVLCRCCTLLARRRGWKYSTAGSDDSGKYSHLQRQVLKVITKGWRHRAHSDPVAQPRPLRRRSAGVWDEPSSCVLPQREGCPLSLITVRAS